MDKHIIGKWYKKEMGETLNIFDETPLRVKLSFSSSGYYNFEPNCVYEDGNDFCFEINDEHFRMVYHLHFENKQLKGYYTQFNKETPVAYKRVSEIPEDGEFQHIPPEMFVPGTNITRLEMLRQYSSYNPAEDCNIESVYQLYDKIPDILKKSSSSASILSFIKATPYIFGFSSLSE
jgi:hypothetical protein